MPASGPARALLANYGDLLTVTLDQALLEQPPNLEKIDCLRLELQRVVNLTGPKTPA